MSSTSTTNQDLEHLRLLAIFHYVYGGMHVLFGFFPLIYVAFGLLMVFAPQMLGPNNPQMGPPPEFFGWFVVVIGGIAAAVMWAIAGLAIHSGWCLARRRRHTFCLIVAAISCIFMPLGTILGVFTILVLSRPSVKELFEAQTRVEDRFGLDQQELQ